ncbi:MAG: hypothetical protein EPN92_05025, partial [Chitinophagaceae bacterium]
MKLFLLITSLQIFTLVIKAQTFEHTTLTTNCAGNLTYLDHPQLNDNPQAIFIAKCISGPDMESVIGLSYSQPKQRWAIALVKFGTINMSIGNVYEITLNASFASFIHNADPTNIKDNRSKIVNPLLSKAGYQVDIILNHNPAGSFAGTNYNHCSVQYENGGYYIVQQSTDDFPTGTSYNVFLTKINVVDLEDTLSIKEDSINAVNPNLPEKDLTPGYIINPDFEEVDSTKPLIYTGWIMEGDAFSLNVGGDVVSTERVRTEMLYENGGIGGDYWKNSPYPTGGKGKRWIGSYENGNQDYGMGTLMSSPFKSKNRYLHFLMAGGSDTAKLYVELQVKSLLAAGYGKTEDGWTKIKKITPAINCEELYRYWFDLNELPAAVRLFPLRIVIVDSLSVGGHSPWGHISVDDFVLTDEIKDTLHILRDGKTFIVDSDRPVWGFADTHTHPMFYLGFGGKTMLGNINVPLEEAMSSEECRKYHGIDKVIAAAITGMLPIMQEGTGLAVAVSDFHESDGYPNFSGFPKFNVKTHQQMHISWIKRAYEGGLRLMCMLSVTNMFWTTRALSPGCLPNLPIDDETTALLAIEEFKKVIAANSDWVEIALTPADARRIILSNKLAIVLGVEMDNFGNFKAETDIWPERYAMPPSSPLVVLSPDLNRAKTQIQDKLKQYYDVGIRQLTPFHYVSGVFGGTAIFRYQFSMVSASVTGKPYLLKSGLDRGIAYNIAKDKQEMQAILSTAWEQITSLKQNGQPLYYFTCDPSGSTSTPISDCNSLRSTRNAQGLTPRGQLLMKEIMRSGFLLDVEHASLEVTDQLFDMSTRYKYPVMSSHSTVAYNGFTGNGDEWSTGSSERNYRNFQTTVIGNLITEACSSDETFKRISNSGGVCGLYTFPFRVKDVPNNTGYYIGNDCDGSSASWAHMYMHMMDVMPGKGIGLSSDRGFTEFVAPRFGPMASYKLMEEQLEVLNKTLRTQQRMSQLNPVSYDIPFKDWNPKRFEGGKISLWEEDLWKAMAFHSGKLKNQVFNDAVNNPLLSDVPISAELLQGDRIKNFVIGLSTNDMAKLPQPDLFNSRKFWEQAAAFCLRQNISPFQLAPVYSEANIKTIEYNYNAMAPVYALWNGMMANYRNDVLRKLVNGNRDWDFNID